MNPQQQNLNRMNEIKESGVYTATICAELCQLNRDAKENGWEDNRILGCQLYGDHCTVQYGPCDACELTI